MNAKTLIQITLAVLVTTVLSNCGSTGSDSGPHYVPAYNGKGGVVLAPR